MCSIFPNLCGIYGIFNTESGKWYIGSSDNTERRLRNHFSQLAGGRHHSSKLQKACEKYGINVFECVVIEECPPDQLLNREQYYIDVYNAARRGYNMLPLAGSPRGYTRGKSKRVWTEEQRRNASEKAKLRAADPAEKKRRSERAKRQHKEKRLGAHVWINGPDRKGQRPVELTPERREAMRQHMLRKWSEPEFREKTLAAAMENMRKGHETLRKRRLQENRK